MISWQLWQALQMPFVSHPIYWMRRIDESSRLQHRQLQVARTQLGKLWRFIHQNFAESVFFLIVVGVIAGFISGSETIFSLFIIAPIMTAFGGIAVILSLIPLFLVISGTLYGFLCALAISDVIGKEKSQGRFSLLGVAPKGLPVAVWALSSVAIHSSLTLKRIQRLIALIYLGVTPLLGLPLLFSLLIILIPNSTGNEQSSFGQTAFFFAVGGFWQFIDYFQSTTIGAVLGMIAPMLTAGNANTRGYAIFLFLSVQAGSYLLAAFLSLLVYFSYQLTLSIPALLIFMLIFYLCREIVIYVLWLILAWVLESDLAELNAVMRLKPFRFSTLGKLPKQVLRLVRNGIPPN